MREKGWGRIVNISSMGGRMYTPFGAWYHATKYAVEALTDCLRLETKPFGIDAVLVEPGGIKTDWGAIAAENLRKTSAGGPRITSYNVCYTKLLRVFCLRRSLWITRGFGSSSMRLSSSARVARVRLVEVMSSSRITSYNVCYTKLLRPDTGTVAFDGRNIIGIEANKRQSNTVFQNYALFPHLSVYENVAFPLRIRKVRNNFV